MSGEVGAQPRELVGEQSGARVAHDGGDGRRLTGDLRLPAEWLELPAQLAGQVAETREVRLHRLELAKGLLLAAPVLQDSRGFLDESAAFLRRRLQDAVEPPLSDDHVHLATQPRVAEQLLHIEQAAHAAVDRVLARAVAEQRAADGHFGVLDRQRAVGVVDRELHLRAAERPPRRGAGEDDVLHLAAAEGLGALLAHDPRERVDDIGLARSVGTDDAGHARSRTRTSSAGRTT